MTLCFKREIVLVDDKHLGNLSLRDSETFCLKSVHRWEDKNKVAFDEGERKVVDWIKLAGGRVQWQAVVMLINRRVRQVLGISWPVEQRYWLVHSGTKVDCFPR